LLTSTRGHDADGVGSLEECAGASDPKLDLRVQVLKPLGDA